MSDTITVSISKKNFSTGVKYAKQFGGKFDPESKTWKIPTHRNGIYNNALNALGNYGLVKVNASDNHDHNCPANFGGACECK